MQTESAHSSWRGHQYDLARAALGDLGIIAQSHCHAIGLANPIVDFSSRETDRQSRAVETTRRHDDSLFSLDAQLCGNKDVLRTHGPAEKRDAAAPFAIQWYAHQEKRSELIGDVRPKRRRELARDWPAF